MVRQGNAKVILSQFGFAGYAYFYQFVSTGPEIKYILGSPKEEEFLLANFVDAICGDANILSLNI